MAVDLDADGQVDILTLSQEERKEEEGEGRRGGGREGEVEEEGRRGGGREGERERGECFSLGVYWMSLRGGRPVVGE